MTRPLPEKKPAKPVIVDTSVWVEYFRGKNQSILQSIDNLIEQRRLRTLNVILAELLRGCLSKKELDVVQDMLGSIPSYEVQDGFWQEVGVFCFNLARQGLTCGLIDGWIALTAIRQGACLYSLDKDFERITQHTALELFK